MYLPPYSPHQTATSQQCSIHAGPPYIPNRNMATPVADQKQKESPVFTRDVAMLRSESGEETDVTKNRGGEKVQERLFASI